MASYTPGNIGSYSLALADTLQKRESLEKSNSKKQSVKAVVEQKQLSKTVSIKLPEIGPVLVDKPLLFDQIASIK